MVTMANKIFPVLFVIFNLMNGCSSSTSSNSAASAPLPVATDAGLTAKPASPVLSGNTTVNFTGSGAGGTATYEYQFWLSNGTSWSLVQDYSTKATWNWNTTGVLPGAYKVQVNVRCAGSKSLSYDAARGMDFIIVSPPASAPPLDSQLANPMLILNLLQPPEEIAVLGTYNVKLINANTIEFSKDAGDLCDTVLYDRVSTNFNFDGLYKVVTPENSTYYFRFNTQYFTSPDVTTFANVSWANNSYPTLPGMMTFSAVSKNIVQSGNAELTLVGDSITWWSQGASLRWQLQVLNPDWRFIGSRTDIYGYGHEGEGGNTTLDVLKRMAGIMPSSNYLVHIGTNDAFTADETFSFIQQITLQLLNKKIDTTVLLATILPRADSAAQDIRNQAVNAKLRLWVSQTDKKIKLVDLETDFRNIPNWQSYLYDSIHPNADGEVLLAKIINKYL